MKHRPIHLAIFFLVFLLGFSPTLLYSQSECGDQLRQAQRRFDEGHPQEALILINDCISQDNYTRNESIEAYRLITIIYLMENDPKAEEYFKKLLRRNPEFRVDESLKVDPGELVFLYENFHTNPLFHLRLYGGVNSTQVNELGYFDIGPDIGDSKIYTNGSGFQVGGLVSIPLFNRNIRLSTGLEFSQISYDLSNTFNAFLDPIRPEFEENTSVFTIQLSEIQQLIKIPLVLSIDFDKWSKYNFKRSRIVPFLHGGVNYHRLLNSSFPEVSTESRIGNFLSSSSFNNGEISELRRKTNLSLVAGGGLKLKLARNYVVFEVRYTHWLQNVVETELRYANAELVHGFGHIDSDFTFNGLAGSVGFEVPIYFPRPRKNK